MGKYAKWIVTIEILVVIFIGMYCRINNINPTSIRWNTPKVKKWEYSKKTVASKGGSTTDTAISGDALNLALLADKNVHAYVKDYFSIINKIAEGSANPYVKFSKANTLPTYCFPGFSMMEIGFNANEGFIPVTFLDVKIPGLKNSGKEYGGEFTLANMTADKVMAMKGNGVRTGQELWLNSSGFGGPFQQSPRYFGPNQTRNGQVLAPIGFKSGKSTNYLYFPDEISEVLFELDQSLNYAIGFHGVQPKSANAKLAIMMAKYADGSKAAAESILGNTYPSNDKVVQMCEDYANDLFQPDGDEFVQKAYKAGIMPFTHEFSNAFMLLYLVHHGWKCSANFRASNVSDSLFRRLSKVVYGKDLGSVSSYVASNRCSDNVSSPASGGGGGFTKTIKGVKRQCRFAAGRSQLMMVFVGKFYYGYMMSKMKVTGVDPTKPSTYLSGLKEGQYKPGNMPATYSDCLNWTGKKVVINKASGNVYHGGSEGSCQYGGNTQYPLGKAGEIGQRVNGIPIWNQSCPYWCQFHFQPKGINTSANWNPTSFGGSGCGIFSMTAIMYYVGWGNVNNPGVSTFVKNMDKVSNSPNKNNGFIDPMELGAYYQSQLGTGFWASGVGFNGNIASYFRKAGLPAESIYGGQSGYQEKILNYLKKGYPVMIHSRHNSVPMYKDVSGGKVQYVNNQPITSVLHYIVLYDYADKKTVDGKTVNVCRIMDSGGGSGRGTNDNWLDYRTLISGNDGTEMVCVTKGMSAVTGVIKTQEPSGEQTIRQQVDYSANDLILDDTLIGLGEVPDLDTSIQDVDSDGITYTVNLSSEMDKVISLENLKKLTANSVEFEYNDVYYELETFDKGVLKKSLPSSYQGKLSGLFNDSSSLFKFRKFTYDENGKKNYIIVGMGKEVLSN